MSELFDALPPWLFNLSSPLTSITKNIYLVGGAVRDAMLGLPMDDYDFVVDQHAIRCARRCADVLNGKFFILDQQRETARALIPIDGKIIKMDFALFNGETIEEDLRTRDFTVNAMAILFPDGDAIIDPTGGWKDLQEKRIKPCSPASFNDDPVRVIRFVRFQEQLGFYADEESEKLAVAASERLEKVSGERQRDAILDVIRMSDLARAFTKMLDYGIVRVVFPGLDKLEQIQLSPPHRHNGWKHTLQVMKYCQQLMMSFSLAPALEMIHPRIEQAVQRLGKFDQYLRSFFQVPLAGERTLYQMLALSALFHDAAKGVVTVEIGDEGRRRFPGHARVGSRIVDEWGRKKGFSRREIALLSGGVRTHMKVSKPKMILPESSDLSIHRFFKRAGDAGILTAILHLADVLATYENAITDGRWNDAVFAVEKIFDAYFNRYNTIISPPLLLNGRDIMNHFSMEPGEEVGLFIKALEEAQVTGKVTDRTEAIRYLELLKSNQH